MSTTGDRPLLSRDALVDAAREVISTVGLDAFTLRRLGDVFNVSAPAMYSHFSDKHELLRAVADIEFERLIARYEEIERNISADDPLGRIRAQCRNYVRMCRDDRELFRLMFLFPPAIGGIGDLPPGSELPAATRALEIAIDTVRDAIDAGALDADEPVLPAMALWAGVHGVANIVLLGLELPEEFVDALTDEVTNRTLLGYGARTSASAS